MTTITLDRPLALRLLNVARHRLGREIHRRKVSTFVPEPGHLHFGEINVANWSRIVVQIENALFKEEPAARVDAHRTAR